MPSLIGLQRKIKSTEDLRSVVKTMKALAAENASRLAAMQGAESNIEDRLDELQGRYHRQRQMGITEELLDVVSGFEALSESTAGRKR